MILEVVNCQKWGREKKKRGKNRQISLFGFQCVAKKHDKMIKVLYFI
jgi:hypothetical protein